MSLCLCTSDHIQPQFLFCSINFPAKNQNDQVIYLGDSLDL